MSERIEFRRKYNSFAKEGQIQYGIIDGYKLGIRDLMRVLDYSDEPLEAQVEAHWHDERRPEKIVYCGATYDFIPRNGLIVAQSTTSIKNSQFGFGVIVHPNTTIHDSAIGSMTEVSNTTTIVSTRIGHGCMIGSNVVIDGCKVLNHSDIQSGETYFSPQALETTGRDYRELAYEGAKW